MATFFLVVIYIAFIGLGTPDSMLGAAWPVMHLDLGADVSSAGIIGMIVSGGTVVSSLLGDRVIDRFGTGRVTFVSVLATALALLGFSAAPRFEWLILLAVPLGLGAGAIDTGLNNYVALHYKPHHMSWLHCFWGIGASIGPMITSAYLSAGDWRGSYRAVTLIQFGIAALLLVTLPLWKENGGAPAEAETARVPVSPLRIPGVLPAMAAFVFYSGIELTLGSWGASYLVRARGFGAATAARYVSAFFMGITVGRLLTGFLTMRMSNKNLIRLGQGVIAAGVALLLLPWGGKVLMLLGLIAIGLGCAPIFPCMLHETPYRFGKEYSQKIIGLQMAAGYTSSTLLPLVIGAAASRIGFGFLPWLLLFCAVMITLVSERVNRVVDYREEL